MKALGAASVYGVSMPANSLDTLSFNSRSKLLASRLRIRHIDLPVDKPSETMLATFNASYPIREAVSRLSEGNLRSRLRMAFLYLVCGEVARDLPGKRLRVVGTGNLSEDFIGYDTKWGDGACDVFPIADFLKKEVYMALEHFRVLGVIDEEHIDRTPSAGLWDGQTDEQELGFSYDEMAPALMYCLQNGESHEPFDPAWTEQERRLVAFVWARHLANAHKIRPIGIRTIPGR